MESYLNDTQIRWYERFQKLFSKEVRAMSMDWESDGVDDSTINWLAKEEVLCGLMSHDYGGANWDAHTYGLLNECVGAFSPSLTGLFNVHFMVIQTLEKWGTESQKAQWLPLLATGKRIGGFALTEPDVGSDIQSLATNYTDEGDYLILNGRKKWITFGGRADVFLIFGKLDGKGAVALVEKDAPGFRVTPINNMLGFRGAHLAALTFDQVRVSKDQMIGSPGLALGIIAPFALIYGRLSVAFASLGMIRGAYEIASTYISKRETFDKKLIDQPVIQQMVAELGMALESATHFCMKAAEAIDRNDPKKMEAVMTAKYYTSKAASRHIPDAVQMMGAMGCNEEEILPRLYRDAKIMEVVEGSNPVLVQLLGKHFAIKAKRQLDKKHKNEQLHAAFNPA